MQTYRGVKTVKARPMTRGEYNAYRGWTLPDDECPDDAGWLVVYPDGYQSWSPAPQFEEAYRPANNLQECLTIERDEADARHDAALVDLNVAGDAYSQEERLSIMRYLEALRSYSLAVEELSRVLSKP